MKEFLDQPTDADAAAIVAAMKEVAIEGLQEARHVRGDIYEVRADGDRAAYRVLFATEGAGAHILLALEAFQKKTRRTPPMLIDLAERRLRDWRSRARGRM